MHRTTATKAAATAPLVTPAHGRGGLLATPGLSITERRAKLRTRRKAEGEERVYARSDDGRFGSGSGTAGDKPAEPAPKPKAAPKKPAAKKPAQAAKPKPADAAPAAKVDHTASLNALGLDPKLSNALGEYLSGINADPPEEMSLNNEAAAALEALGIIKVKPGQENEPNKSIELTPLGKKLDKAVQAGDVEKGMQAVEAAHTGYDKREAKRAERDTKRADALARREAKRAEAQAKRDAKKKPATEKAMRPGRKKAYWKVYAEQKARGVDRALARKAAGQALRKATAAKLRAQAARITRKGFAVYKDADGRERWLCISSTAYKDRDQEIVSSAALNSAVAIGDATGERGPLRLWHVPGWDIGDCDFQATLQDGRFLLESGTFRSPQWAKAVKAMVDDLGVTIGFHHPEREPGASGVFSHIAIFERSLAPRGRVSNLFTAFRVKEVTMLTTEKAAWLKKNFPPELAEAMIAQAAQTDKAAQAAGLAFKEAAPASTIPNWNGVTWAGPADVVINGITYKAVMPPAEMIEAGMTEMADGAAEEALEEGDEEAAENLLSDAEIDTIATRTAEKIMGMLDGVSAKMNQIDEELKGRGYSRMKEAIAAEFGARFDRLDAALKEFISDQPRTVYRASEAADTIDVAQTIKQAAAQTGEDPLVAWAFANNNGAIPWAVPAIHNALNESEKK